MHKIRKEEGQQTKKQGLLPILFPWDICSLFLKGSVQYIAIYVFNFSIPLFFCVIPIYGRKYSMKVKLFMENMWEFFLVFYFFPYKVPCMQGNFLCFYFVPYKVNIPMYAGEFFLCYFFVPCKFNIPMYEGGFKQVQNKEYICWIQVKIHISDQTPLRICSSA